ncbi:MAG: hypothetical protein RIC55_14765 [Pirellulaceae bacterium]
MARAKRGDVFDPTVVGVYHCINRCVRRCFLCGDDAHTGRNFDHRKRWLELRLERLAGCFAIDVLGYAVMDNHFHIILRNRPDVLVEWDDQEVARRWLLLCPVRKTPEGDAEEPTDAEIAALVADRTNVAEIRSRLCDISWFMRMAAEPIARRANREDGVTGHFWEGRFRCSRLLDEAALLACCVYVDLNPVRAGLAPTPETSEFTSASRRIEAEQEHASDDCECSPGKEESADAWLAPLPLEEGEAQVGPALSVSGESSVTGRRCSDRGFLPLTLSQYLELLDWTGRQHVPGKRGVIPSETPPILARLRIAERDWLELTFHFGRLFQHHAGRPSTLARLRPRPGTRRRALGSRLLGEAR